MSTEHGARRAPHYGQPDDAYPSLVQPEDIRAIRREEAFRANELADLPDPLTDDEYEAAESAWAQYQEWLTESVTPLPHTHRGCGHPCLGGACASTAGKNDPLCVDCQLRELSDSEKHRARRRVAS